MCFSKEFSFFNFALLSGYGSYLAYQNPHHWRLYVPAFYLGLKDFLQGFLYIFNTNQSYKYILSILSYIHICFQPLIANIFFSYFSTSAIRYWNIVLPLLFLYGLYKLTDLDVFNILLVHHH